LDRGRANRPIQLQPIAIAIATAINKQF